MLYIKINDKIADDVQEYLTPSGIKFNEIESRIDTFMKQNINKTISGAQISITKNDKLIFSK